MSVGILLLAAGESVRYRAACGRHKLLEPVEGEAMLARCYRIAMQSGLPVAIVLRPEPLALRNCVAGAQQIVLPSAGIGNSVAAGVQATSHWDGWLIMLADMPWLQPETLLQVAQALKQHKQVRTCWQGMPGHPVGFSRDCYPQLAALSGETAARDLLKQSGVYLLTTQDAGTVQDIDLPAMWLNKES
ncbi:nucleotidyltransferase family protein [Mixta intestinalis]|uniref:Purine catabolism protein PucB n=1 Tax=Mixta intestinalis TaxID=1615494 RepID=A0A6P1PWA6_9GAMM|nr:nucleotidyltransferase family protein [Mixta intestinalis]QHM70796.1 Purine catabolism protein PucB [Mixta intestinalis]